MKAILRASINATVLAIGLALLPSPASAALLSVDSKFGLDTLVRDTESQIDWLDISFTHGLSVNQALALTVPSGLIPGFRMATLAEWIDFTNYPSGDPGFALIAAMGCTQCAPESNFFRLDGVVLEDTNTAGGYHGAGVINDSVYIQSMFVDPSFANPGLAIFLVAEAGSTPNNPLLPPGEGEPIIGVIDDFTTKFFDPDFATGYDYSVDPNGPLITSALVPSALPGGDAIFDLIYGETSYLVTAGTPFDFSAISPGGVSSFSLRGIDLTEQIDPSDPLGFVTGLTFSRLGTVSLKMTPFITSTVGPPGAVPEPATWVMMLAGFGFVGHAMRRSRRRWMKRLAAG